MGLRRRLRKRAERKAAHAGEGAVNSVTDG